MTDTRPLAEAARLAARYRQGAARASPWPTASLDELRAGLCCGVPEHGRDAAEVIAHLARASEPGLVGTASPAFHGWVMGGSHPVGVAAEWLASAWGQNAALYQCSPAAAVAEEAAAQCLLDLLDLPRESSVGFTTGATAATFVGLAAGRLSALERAGWDLDDLGMCGAPRINVFLGAEAHSSVRHALRLLGFGRRQLVDIAADRQGRMEPAELSRQMAARAGPAIVIAQAGHINTGAFDDLTRIAAIAKAHGAWLHVDGAFGLWARASVRLRHLAQGAELADSLAVDGHKWLQVPYDCGYAVLADAELHRRAMAQAASYLTRQSGGGRDPSDYVPELSRRGRGFATWAVIQALGRRGIGEIVERSCANARLFAECCEGAPEIEVMNEVGLNQVCLAPKSVDQDAAIVEAVRDALRRDGRWFAMPARWRERPVLRFSFCGPMADRGDVEAMAAVVACTFARESALAGARNPRPAACAA